MKTKFPILIAAASASVFFIVLISSLYAYLYSLGYYDKKYGTYGVYSRFSRDKALSETEGLFGFFRSGQQLDEGFFNTQEISHLSDVKAILDKVSLINIISVIAFWAIIAFVYARHKRIFAGFISWTLMASGALTIGILLLLAIIYFTMGFESVFELFHKLFFTGNYAFDPTVSNMKALLPDEFFRDIAIDIIKATAAKAILISGAGFFLARKTINKSK